MKAKANWEDMDPAGERIDRFHIPDGLIPEGMSLQWVTDSVMGEQRPQDRAEYEKKGWTPVHQEDFGARFDGVYMPKGAEGEINSGGQVLMARPVEYTEKARRHELQKAREQVSIREAALRGGDIPGVSFDTRHETVSNKVNRSFERVAIPQDD